MKEEFSHDVHFDANHHHHNPNKKRRTNRIATGPISKPPTRKPDPRAPKITRPCSECGKKFWSWKALFGHMRCHPDRQWRGINPPPNFRPQPDYDDEDREVAACLLILANQGEGVDDEEEEEVGCCVNWGHKCSVCMRVFSSGQALGGHKRCHRDNVNAATAAASTRALSSGALDLNLPLQCEDRLNILQCEDDCYDSSSYLDLRLRL